MAGVITLHHPDGQVFDFDAGTLCLELVCTTGGEGFRARFEVLHSPADIVTWAALSRLDLAAHGVDPAEVDAGPEDLADLRRLREAIWSVAFTVATTGADGSPGEGSTGDAPAVGGGRFGAELAVINELAGGRGLVPRWDPVTGAAGWQRPVTAGQFVTEIARDAVRIFGTAAIDRVRRCAGDNCALLYLDTSRPGRRRWCSMQRCGNRHKVAGHRRRQQTVIP
ncbi:CGNR zinc finger domain-containing protein [Micromonospora sp. NBC_01796]|uniref:CGNR zinc finger domain-containing protein n=1 Tax=Micromonospora sp. NBC_01796 TaxID=2975987 RepID=UPI002DD9E832|nr:CGNR zinc finger domain-containing protein [Micromonospora sp. NBC_01796]WSA83179.1 CGNR zinc finger domain-containing protein [Micromonospora sp. NBC_01796]